MRIIAALCLSLIVCPHNLFAFQTESESRLQKPDEGTDDRTDVEKDVVDFKDLTSTDGKVKSLADYPQDFVVVCFTSNTCPYSVDYEPRMIQLQKSFREHKSSAVLVAINSNAHKDDTLEQMKARAEKQNFNFDYLKDEDQEVAKLFDAVYTPEFFVLNQARRVVYQGALDDATSSEAVTVNYVSEAIEALLSGKQPEISKTGARGCRIRFQRRRRK